MTIKRPWIAMCVATFIILSLIPPTTLVVADHGEEPDFSGPWSKTLHEGPYDRLPFEDTRLTSDVDGVEIEVGWWRPDVPDDVQVPIILLPSPYHGSMYIYGTNVPLDSHVPVDDITEFSSMDGAHTYMPYLLENFLPHGYAVAAIAIRGTGGSGGCIEYWGPNETADLGQATTWLAGQEWTDGNIAVWGSSYDGAATWQIASTGNPHVKTIVPMNSIVDSHDRLYRNGTAHPLYSTVQSSLYWGAHSPRVPRTVDDLPQPFLQHRVDAITCEEGQKGLLASSYSSATGEHDPFGYWAARDYTDDVRENYQGSILAIGGFADTNTPSWNTVPFVQTLADDGLPVWQLHHQAGHRPPDIYDTDSTSMRWDWAEYLLGWFDHWLKGDESVDLGRSVQIEERNGSWRFMDSFPSKDTQWSDLHLDDGGFSDTPQGKGEVLLTPRGTQGTFLPGTQSEHRTGPLSSSLHLSGLPRLHVTVTPASPSAQIGAWLYAVDPDGEEERIGWAQMNLDFANDDNEYDPATPGEPLVAKLEFAPLDAAVPQGHEILLRVWLYPMAGRSPTLLPTPVTLHYGEDTHSLLRLPIVNPEQEDYFEPPRP